MIELFMALPTKTDAQKQRVRFLSSRSDRFKHWLDPVVVGTRNEWMALPRISSDGGMIGMPWPELVKVGEYPLYSLAQRVISQYLDTKQKCECGAPKRHTYQRCADCTDRMIEKRLDACIPAANGVDFSTRRTDDHREVVRETKSGIDR
jgi:hypothetical protein